MDAVLLAGSARAQVQRLRMETTAGPRGTPCMSVARHSLAGCRGLIALAGAAATALT